MSLVGRNAPNIIAAAVMPDGSIDNQFNLAKYSQGKRAIILFYPLDFTFVCPSEIIAFSRKNNEFRQRDAVAITVSVDSHFTHAAYRKTPLEKGGIGEIEVPMISDITKEISRNYGVLTDGGIALRGTFIIDKNGIVKHSLVNDLPLGRNIDEIVRTLDALIHVEENGEVCPAGWRKGDKAMKPTQEGVSDYLKKLIP
ncbi:putative peroxiredoxin [Candidatus Cyrtobacter comes]|uniref:Thioredoxin peroxidase n=1 Tax=Candidatus Cyrtobacter comes TaxID=675776 RepID=A0ABU5L9J4_9RICK|nr:peroxiredoxin [Candidatus Cyrtobacter comes]MDZ5762575.1 putative peroxiredoxin [Candidatus Cyrtobacter comes]